MIIVLFILGYLSMNSPHLEKALSLMKTSNQVKINQGNTLYEKRFYVCKKLFKDVL